MHVKYFWVLLFSAYCISFAQTNCGQTFDQVDHDCIVQFSDKLKSSSILLDKIKIDQVFFYQTSEGVFGKLKIIGKEVREGECSVYWESETFSNPTSFKTNTNLTINNKVGVWNNREINLDYSGNRYDFMLKRSSNGKSNEEKCYLEVIGDAKVYSYKVMSETKTVEGNKLIFYASMILIGAATFFLVFNFLKEEEKMNAQEKLSEQEVDTQANSSKKFGLILKYSRPFIKRYFSETVERMSSVNKIKEKYKRPLANAGLLKIFSPTDFYSFKFLLVIVFPILYLVSRWLFELDLPVDYVFGVTILGYYYPDLWLKFQTNKRREEIFLAMPFIVDMLALSIEAGLDFIAAISRVVEKAPPSALTDEFQIMLKEIKIGSSRADALRQLSWRVDEISVNSFCATLIAADSVGASVGPVLKSLSRELRNKRSTLVEKKAAQAASKIMVPMILIILPAIFLIVIAPPMMEFFK